MGTFLESREFLAIFGAGNSDGIESRDTSFLESKKAHEQVSFVSVAFLD